MKNLLSALLKTGKAPSTSPPLKILVIEDDDALVEVLNELFSELGYIYKVFSNTDDILPLMEDLKPDLILLDYLLPHINGGELCSQVKNHKPSSKIPVIIFSAFPKVLMSLGDYGCDAFIEKPFDLNELIKKIERLAARNSRYH